MLRRPPTPTLFPTRRSSDLHAETKGNRRYTVRLLDTITNVYCLGFAGLDKERPDYLSIQQDPGAPLDRKSTRLNSSHVRISYAVFCLKKKITVRSTAAANTT